MEVVFEVCNNRYTTIEIGFFDTVEEMKERVERKHGFPIARQTLVYNGKVLKDEHDAEHYEIYEGCLIRVLLEPERRKVQVVVKRPTRQYPLEVDVSDTVGLLKEKIQEYEGVQPGRLLASHSGVEMEDNRCLAEYGVSDQSEISVVLKPNTPTKMMRVLVETSKGGVKIPVDVNPSSTVHDLKMKLEDKGIAPNEHFFVYNHDVMYDNRTLRWHRVQDGDTLSVFKGSVSGGM
ncbi:Polyubiquitin-B [Nymphaea thermarum]|nr:Polyubiquitin-B [Nymphaea thermarum]